MFYAVSFPGLSERFGAILDGICRALGARMVRDDAVRAVLMMVWSRLRRVMQRFARVARGDARIPSPKVYARGAATRREGRLPEGFGWLVRMAPGVNGHRSQLEYLLRDPEMLALLEAVPSLGRMLRPLCRMLAIVPEAAVATAGLARVVRSVVLPSGAAPVEDGLAGGQSVAAGGSCGVSRFVAG